MLDKQMDVGETTVKLKNIFNHFTYFRGFIFIVSIVIVYFLLHVNDFCSNKSLKMTIRSNSIDKMIVVSHFNEDIDWLDLFIGEMIPHLVYTRSSDSLARHNFRMNKGREAVAYLRFIIDHYDDLPRSIAFVHAHRTSWHQRDPSDIVVALRAAKWNKYSYIPLTSTMTRAFFDSKSNNEQWKVNSIVWKDVLQSELGSPPINGIHASCCASFIVQRNAILKHRKEFYAKIYDYLLTSSYSDQLTGRTLEYTWHMIFGQPAHINFDKCLFFFCDNQGQISVVKAENDSLSKTI